MLSAAFRISSDPKNPKEQSVFEETPVPTQPSRVPGEALLRPERHRRHLGRRRRSDASARGTSDVEKVESGDFKLWEMGGIMDKWLPSPSTS